jgi:inner membrane protein
MFNSTHTLVGLAIARTAAGNGVRRAAVIAAIASNLPDIEIVTGFFGTPAYIEFHRGITHTLIGVPVLALLLAGAVHFFSGNFRKTYVLALIVMATHPLLDYANTYGLRPFLPFDGKWYYGDILFIFDPYIDAILLLAIIVGRFVQKRGRAAAWASIILVVAYVGGRVELHEMAKSRMQAFVARTPAAGKWAVFPRMLDPFTWDGIAQIDNQLVRMRVRALHGVENEITRMDRGSSTEVVAQARKAESAGVLLRFARFPAVQVENLDLGYRVTFLDFSFYSATFHRALGCEVILDRSLRIVRESLSFDQSVR